MKELAEALNADLASEDVLYHQYKKHHSVVDGPMRPALHSLFEELASEVFRNEDLLGERLTLLGGVPISERPLHHEAAYIEPEEAAGVRSLRAMLQSDLTAEQCIIVALSRHIVLACELCDNDTEETLKYIMSKHEEHVAKLAWLLFEKMATWGLREARGDRAIRTLTRNFDLRAEAAVEGIVSDCLLPDG